MTFQYPLMLGGLALASLPVVIHLLMRQKPRRIQFPALRFLQQGRTQTTRKLRLRQLLLLALRVLLILLVVLALARPRIFRPDLGLQGEQPIAAILVIDTTPSMEYAVGGKSRLDDAKARARELLDRLPPDSRVAILDTADQVEEWSPTLPSARQRLDDLQIAHARSRARRANGSVTRQIGTAYRMFARLKQEDEGDALPQVLFVFSDRTSACWNKSELREVKKPEGARAVFVDVGVQKPRDLAITELLIADEHRAPRQSFLPGQNILFGVTVEAAADGSNEPWDAEVHFRLIDEEKEWDSAPVRLRPGNHETVWFKRKAAQDRQTEKIKGLAPGWHQAEVQLARHDELPFNDQRFATFQVRDKRPVLVLTDDPKAAAFWAFDAKFYGLFTCEVVPVSEARSWDATRFAAYPAICLVNVAEPTEALWENLKHRVENGGGLVIVPGGDNWPLRKDRYNGEKAAALLPGAFGSDEMAEVPAKQLGISWQADLPAHPLLKLFREWSTDEKISFNREETKPRVSGYWQIKPYQSGTVVVRYDDKEKTPAILERGVGQGRVLMLTTPFDDSRGPPTKGASAWNTYRQTVFSPILVSLVLGYLAGESDDPNFNYLPGQVVPVAFPALSRSLNFILSGPGLSTSDAAVRRGAKDQPTAEIDQAVTPGNYALVEVIETPGEPPRENRFAKFSVNSDPRESKLDRVDVKEIEDQLGPGSVVPLDYSQGLLERLQDRWPQSLELMPYLMILVLLLLAAENLLSNLFYRRKREVDPTIPERPELTVEALPAGQPQEVAG